MEPEDNPLLQPEDFLKGYRDSIEELKNRPELVQFDKICYELFSSDIGKKFMEYVTDNYLIPPLADRTAKNFAMTAVWAEGFKDFARMIRAHIRSHSQRIAAEGNK